MKHAIYGTITFASGLVVSWLRFIDREEFTTISLAKAEAMRIVLAQHKGMGIVAVATT
jgi:hypothetical protein